MALARSQSPAAGRTMPAAGQAGTSRSATGANGSAVDWSSTIELIGGVLARLGDVMGSGALYSLVRYGSLDEGARLGTKINGPDPEAALKAAGRLLHLDVSVGQEGGGAFRLRIRPPPYLRVAKGGTVGLIVGLFEGTLSSILRTKYQLSGEPRLDAGGELTILLKE
ncbi:MAG: hypothetical protein HYT80_08040 [Euryarchaeota archaeon]|nr:hypothetical protein [Euryarchaeota archaeon]